MQGFAWRRREGSVAQKTLDPHHSPATGRFRFQYLLFLSALMVLAGLTLSSSGAAPAAYQYYILNPRIQNAPLLVMSLAPVTRKAAIQRMSTRPLRRPGNCWVDTPGLRW